MISDKTNSFWLSSQFILAIGISLVTLKLNLNYFGEEIFGIWILISSLWGFGTVIDFGFGIVLIKKVAESRSSLSENLKELLSTFFFSFVMLGIILTLSISILGKIIYIDNSNLIPLSLNDTANSFFYILGIAFFFRFINIFFKSFFEGLSDFKKTSKINIISNLLILFSVLIVINFSLSIVHLALGYLLSSFLTLLVLLIAYHKKINVNSLNIKLYSYKKFKELFSLSIGVQGAAIFGRLIDPVIKYSIGLFYSLDSVSYYEIAYRFVSALSGLFNTAFKIILPKTSILKNKDDYKNYILTEGFMIQKFGITYAGFVYGVGSIFLTVFIYEWFGYKESILFFLMLALPEAINRVGFLMYNFFMGIGKVYFLAMIQLINLIIVTASLYVGFLIFNNYLGLLGYLVTIIFVNTLMIIYMKKTVGNFYLDFFRSSIFYKMIILLFLMLGTMLTIFYSEILYIIPITGLSLTSLILFYKEIFFFGRKFFLVINPDKR